MQRRRKCLHSVSPHGGARPDSHRPASAAAGASARTVRWRRERRAEDLRALVQQCKRIRWSSRLLQLLVEELYVGDELVALIGPLRRVALRRYPEAVAVSLILRHSWRHDDLRTLARRLGIALRPRSTKR